MPLSQGLSWSWKCHPGLQCHLKVCWDEGGDKERGFIYFHAHSCGVGKPQCLATWPLHGIALQHPTGEQFKREHKTEVAIWPQEWVCSQGQLHRHMTSAVSLGLALEGPYAWFNALLYHLEMLKKFWTRGLRLSFCLESYNLCSKSCTPRSHVFTKCHWTQIRTTF